MLAPPRAPSHARPALRKHAAEIPPHWPDALRFKCTAPWVYGRSRRGPLSACGTAGRVVVGNVVDASTTLHGSRHFRRGGLCMSDRHAPGSFELLADADFRQRLRDW